MKSKWYGPSAQVTQRSGFAQCFNGAPLRVVETQSGWATRTSSRTACGSVRATTCMSRERHPATSTSKRIAVAHPGAAMMQRNFGGIVGDDAAGAEGGGVGVKPPEVVDPELGIEAAGIVLDQRELRPAHGPIEPAACCRGRCGRLLRRGRDGSGRGGRPDRRERTGAGDLEKVPAGKVQRHAQIVAAPRLFAFLMSRAGAGIRTIESARRPLGRAITIQR
jgi:hypothetical protein